MYRGTSKPDPFVQETFNKENIDTIEKVFQNTARQYGHRKALGTREVLGEEDEVQADGKIHKKVVIHHHLFTNMNYGP